MDTDRPRHGHETDADPHLWLDFANAMKMVDNIRDGLSRGILREKDVYEKNAASYNEKLKDLDARYHAHLKVAKSGASSAANTLRLSLPCQPIWPGVWWHTGSPRCGAHSGKHPEVARTLKQNGSRYLFYEELLDPRVARTIASETGASLIRLHGAHNLTKEEFDRGETLSASWTEIWTISRSDSNAHEDHRDRKSGLFLQLDSVSSRTFPSPSRRAVSWNWWARTGRGRRPSSS